MGAAGGRGGRTGGGRGGGATGAGAGGGGAGGERIRAAGLALTTGIRGGGGVGSESGTTLLITLMKKEREKRVRKDWLHTIQITFMSLNE